MNERWVVNASPIISLARIGCAELMLDLYSQVVVPYGVYEEIAACSVVDPAVSWIRRHESLLVREIAIPATVSEWNLGKGEAQVLAYAYLNKAFTASIDDRPAKRCAEALSIRVCGTIALIVEAKRRQLVPCASALLVELRANGFRMTESLFAKALSLSNEAS